MTALTMISYSNISKLAKLYFIIFAAAVADGDNILAPLDVVRARQFQHQYFVKRWQGQEVEAVEAFNGREPRRLEYLQEHEPTGVSR